MKPKVSIITPVYNCEEFLEETILSVLNCQTQIPFEYIVINDGSTDNSLNIINSYHENLFVIDQYNRGEAESVNSGLNLAKGDYCLIVNADDPLLSGQLLDESLKILESNSDVIATYVDWQIIDASGQIKKTHKTKNYSERELIGYFNCLPGPGAIFRTKEGKEIGGRSTKFRYVSDYDFWLRLSTKGKFQRIPKVLAQWRTHPMSSTINSNAIQMAEERISLIEHFIEFSRCDKDLARIATGHAYYYASRLALQNPKVRGKYYLYRSFMSFKGIPTRANFLVVIFILFNPISNLILRFFHRLIDRQTR